MRTLLEAFGIFLILAIPLAALIAIWSNTPPPDLPLYQSAETQEASPLEREAHQACIGGTIEQLGGCPLAACNILAVEYRNACAPLFDDTTWMVTVCKEPLQLRCSPCVVQGIIRFCSKANTDPPDRGGP